MGHIIVSLNDNYCIASIVAKHCVEHKICYKGFDQVQVFFYEETFILEMTLGFMPQSCKWNFISTDIGIICHIALLF